MPKAKAGNFTLKTIDKKVPAAMAAHRFAALQRSGQYSELRFIQRGSAYFDIVGYKWPSKSVRRKLNIGRARKNPTEAKGATPNQVLFGSRGKTKVGWINRETPTKYEIAYKEGAQLKTVMRDRSKIRFMMPKSKRKNPCPKTANPSQTAAAAELSRKFHQLEPRFQTDVKLEWPKALTAIGDCAQVDYISDKFDGKARQYFHKFKKPCRIYAAPKKLPDGQRMLIIIGKFDIKPEGIV